MKHQDTKPLGEFIEERTERLRTDSTTIYSVTNELGFVRSLDLFDKQVFSADTGNYKRVAFQDLAYNPSRINVGSVAMLEDKSGGAVSPMYVIVRCRPGLLPHYLLHFLKSDTGINQIRQRCEGAVRFQLKFRDLCAIPIYAPSLDEQKRIVNLLGKADELRKLRTKADHRTAVLIASVFHKMFDDHATNQKGFRKEPLEKLIRVKSGESLSAKDMETDGQFPVYGGNGINGYHNKFMFEQPIIVIGRVGAHCGAVHLSKPKSWVTDNALYLCDLKEEFDLLYLAEALRTANLNQYAGRAAQPLVSGNRIYPVPIIVPPLPLQKEFAQRVTEIRELEGSQTTSRTRLDALFQSILHRAFNGEL